MTAVSWEACALVRLYASLLACEQQRAAQRVCLGCAGFRGFLCLGARRESGLQRPLLPHNAVDAKSSEPART